jgi:hypothetical protein
VAQAIAESDHYKPWNLASDASRKQYLKNADAAIVAMFDHLIAEVDRLIEEQRVEMGVEYEDIGWTSPELLNRQAWFESMKDSAI